MTLIKRTIETKIKKQLFRGKALIIYGPRQVGKTTLVKQIIAEYAADAVYLNCDEPDIRQALTDKTSTELLAYIGQHRLVVIDEAQRVKNIGLTLKILVDSAPQIQIVATGSSAFDLSNDIREPLTGRVYEFYLSPISVSELLTTYSKIEVNRLLEKRLIYGMYPEIVMKEPEAENLLKLLTKSYLYKDVLEYQKIKNPDILERLLQALALQIGHEVSLTELSSLLGIDKKTVATYIRILEQAFIIFPLKPLHRNPRQELGKLRKVYFYDTGIRNSLINNFNPLSLRQDTGDLWENFIVNERRKQLLNQGKTFNWYFWRTWNKQKIDLVEEGGGKLTAYEIKWQKISLRPPKQWNVLYPQSVFKYINRDNFLDLLGSDLGR